MPTEGASSALENERILTEIFTAMPRILFKIMAALMLAHIAAVLAGCGSFVPPKVQNPAFEHHAVTREKSNVTITVAVLTARESLEFFGVPLESKGIQAVWLKVDNRNAYVVYIVPRSTDPNYFSAYEAAYVNHHTFSQHSNERTPAASKTVIR